MRISIHILHVLTSSPSSLGRGGCQVPSFYDESRFAIIPMGFCYPGRGNDGAKPPRRECAQIWLDSLLEKLESVQLKLSASMRNAIFSVAAASGP